MVRNKMEDGKEDEMLNPDLSNAFSSLSTLDHTVHDKMEDRKEGDMVQPEVPFRFFDLPFEIRSQILRYCLVRGKVAYGSTSIIRLRFPGWRHEPPQWTLLNAVSRQMQREASDVVFSSLNTFFLAKRTLYL